MEKLELDDRKLRFIKANMKFEGLHVSEKSMIECKMILKKEVSGEEVVQSCVCKYKKEQ